uniref:Lipocalin n=1 Tax=Rhipicephalus zambeziensis TaxID=60191 RepID=A0A224YIX6_9ACAR
MNMKVPTFLAVVSILVTTYHVFVWAEEAPTKKHEPDFDKAFLDGAIYGVHQQGIYVEKSVRPRWCATLRRQGTGPNNLFVTFIYDGIRTMGTATMTFFSQTGTGNKNAANVSDATPQMFEELNTNADPYILLYAKGTDCMVVSVPKDKPKGEAATYKDKVSQHYCVILKRLHHANTKSVDECVRNSNVFCYPYKRPRVNNAQCVQHQYMDEDLK